MPKALKLTRESAQTIADEINMSVRDVLVEVMHLEELKAPAYVIVDYTNSSGTYFRWVEVPESFFVKNAVFVESESPTEFREVAKSPTMREPQTLCVYEDRWSGDQVGYIPICTVHNQNSKYTPEQGANRPCLAIKPWTEPNA